MPVIQAYISPGIMQAMTSSGRSMPRALVVGAGLNGLGVIRSLARAGVAVDLAGADPGGPGMSSRYGRKHRLSSSHGTALKEDLLRIAEREGWQGEARPVLFLTEEESVASLRRDQTDLHGAFRFTLPHPAVLEKLMHKEGFRELAEAAGSPIPATRQIREGEELDAAKDLRYPIVLKPGRRDAAYSARFRKAYRVESYAELETLCHQIRPVLDDLVVQEWIEGRDSDIYFCLQYRSRKGKHLSFTGRKLRSWPPGVGGTASCTAAPDVAEELDHLTSDFFTATGVVGLASMEFKRDARSGVFMMVEPTVGRTDYQEEVSTLNGINIPYAAYLLELGLDIPEFRQSVRPVVWRDSRADRQSAAMTGQSVDLNGARVMDALWRRDDPGPKIAELQTRIKTRANRYLERLRRSGKAHT